MAGMRPRMRQRSAKSQQQASLAGLLLNECVEFRLRRGDPDGYAGVSMPARLLFLLQQRIKRVGVRAELMKILGGSETGELVSAAAFSDTEHAGSSQVSHRGWIALGESRFIYGQHVQHL